MQNEIKKLIEGNIQFRNKFFNEENSLFYNLAQTGQRPKVMVIACSDSRIDPSMIFNSNPGEMFVIRNVANLVPPCEDNNTYHGTSAALEFGINFLQVEHIIILGHTKCGGIEALIANAEKILNNKQQSFITKWMSIAIPAYKKIEQYHNNLNIDEKIVLCEQYTLINSLNNLLTFPFIQEKVTTQKLSVHAWYFNLENGKINSYDQQNETWNFL